MRLRLALLPLAILLVAATKPDVTPAPYRLLSIPGAENMVSPDDDVSPGRIIARAQLAEADAVQLTAPMTIAWSGEKRRWNRYQMLDAAHVPDRPDLPDIVYCEWRQDGSAGKVLGGQMLFGLVGALRSTSTRTRFCLFDTNGDGMLDHAVLIGAKRASNRGAFAIPPMAVKAFPGQPIADSEVRLRYAGDTGTPGTLAFDIEVSLHGLAQPVPDARHVVPIASLPAKVRIGDARITILAYRPSTRAANLWVEHGLAPGYIGRDGALTHGD